MKVAKWDNIFTCFVVRNQVIFSVHGESDYSEHNYAMLFCECWTWIAIWTYVINDVLCDKLSMRQFKTGLYNLFKILLIIEN